MADLTLHDMDWQDFRDWDNERIMETYISSPEIDKQNDLIPTEAIKSAMDFYMKYGIYSYKHDEIPIGRPLSYCVKDGKVKLKVGIYDKLPMHNKVWKEIQEHGKKGTSSIRGEALDKKVVCDEGTCHNLINELGLWSVSWVGDNPANKDAVVSFVSMAKYDDGEDPLIKQLKTVHNMLVQKYNGITRGRIGPGGRMTVDAIAAEEEEEEEPEVEEEVEEEVVEDEQMEEAAEEGLVPEEAGVQEATPAEEAETVTQEAEEMTYASMSVPDEGERAITMDYAKNWAQARGVNTDAWSDNDWQDYLTELRAQADKGSYIVADLGTTNEAGYNWYIYIPGHDDMIFVPGVGDWNPEWGLNLSDEAKNKLIDYFYESGADFGYEEGWPERMGVTQEDIDNYMRTEHGVGVEAEPEAEVTTEPATERQPTVDEIAAEAKEEGGRGTETTETTEELPYGYPDDVRAKSELGKRVLEGPDNPDGDDPASKLQRDLWEQYSAVHGTDKSQWPEDVLKEYNLKRLDNASGLLGETTEQPTTEQPTTEEVTDGPPQYTKEEFEEALANNDIKLTPGSFYDYNVGIVIKDGVLYDTSFNEVTASDVWPFYYDGLEYMFDGTGLFYDYNIDMMYDATNDIYYWSDPNNPYGRVTEYDGEYIRDYYSGQTSAPSGARDVYGQGYTQPQAGMGGGGGAVEEEPIEEEPQEEKQEATIKERDGLFCVIDAKGKELKCYKTKEEAEARLKKLKGE